MEFKVMVQRERCGHVASLRNYAPCARVSLLLLLLLCLQLF